MVPRGSVTSLKVTYIVNVFLKKNIKDESGEDGQAEYRGFRGAGTLWRAVTGARVLRLTDCDARARPQRQLLAPGGCHMSV